MLKKEKIEIANELKQEIAKAEFVILMSHKNLTFDSLDAARRASFGKATIKKVKNNIIKFAFESSNHKNIKNHLKDENFMILSNSLFDACKSAKFFLDNNKNQVKLLAAACNNQVYKNETITELAAVDSVQQLQSNLLRVIKVVSENLVRVISRKFESN